MDGPNMIRIIDLISKKASTTRSTTYSIFPAKFVYTTLKTTTTSTTKKFKPKWSKKLFTTTVEKSTTTTTTTTRTTTTTATTTPTIPKLGLRIETVKPFHYPDFNFEYEYDKIQSNVKQR